MPAAHTIPAHLLPKPKDRKAQPLAQQQAAPAKSEPPKEQVIAPVVAPHDTPIPLRGNPDLKDDIARVIQRNPLLVAGALTLGLVWLTIRVRS